MAFALDGPLNVRVVRWIDGYRVERVERGVSAFGVMVTHLEEQSRPGHLVVFELLNDDGSQVVDARPTNT